MPVPNHLRCLGWALAGAVFGLAAAAHGQEPGAVAPVGDPTGEALLRLLSSGGLPVVLAWLGWLVRGLLVAGVPVTVSLSEPDRELLRKAAEPAKKP